MKFTRDVLRIDPDGTIAGITEEIRMQVRGVLRRRGVVVGVSGGIDSSVSAALASRAVGAENVLAVLMPERESSPDSLRLGKHLCESLGLKSITEEISPILDGAACYQRQLEAIRLVYPEFGDGWKHKLVLPSILESDRLNISYLVVRSPDGNIRRERIPLTSYLQIVAATNFKQRTRTMMLYYHADRSNFAVCGTPNRLEYDQGFFVKGGDGLADFKPIAHLYKTQVYQIAEALGIPEEIRRRPPTTDTFSLPQTQDEFYFSLPYEEMDLCLYALNHGIPSGTTAELLKLETEQIERVYADILGKRRGTLPHHLPALMAGSVPEIATSIHNATQLNRP